MTVNPSGWRPSAPAGEQGEAHTVTGNRALMLEEPLIFEIGTTEETGVDFECSPAKAGVQSRSRLPSAQASQSQKSAALRASARGCR